MRLRTLVALTLVVAVIGGLAIGVYNLARIAVTTTGDHRATSADYVPMSYGPRIDDINYCGYFYDKSERDEFGDYGRTCTPYLYPSAPPHESFADYYVQMRMWEFLLGNDTWLRGPYYYDHVLLPTSRRTTTIVVNRNTYIGDGSRFQSTYRADHDRLAKTNPPRFRKTGDKSPTPKVFAGDKFATQANRAADVTKEQTAKKYGGLNPGAVADPAKAAKAGQGKAADKAKDAKRNQKTTTYGGTDSSRDPTRTRQTSGGTSATQNRTSTSSRSSGSSSSSTSTSRSRR